jgi:hypothetical protein
MIDGRRYCPIDGPLGYGLPAYRSAIGRRCSSRTAASIFHPPDADVRDRLLGSRPPLLELGEFGRIEHTPDARGS